MVRFGILGAGRIGKVHAKSLADSGRAEVAYIADALPDAAAALAQSVGAKTASVDEVLASDVDAILIATPTDTHADLIEKAANAGKAILCEKPVSLSVERSEINLQGSERDPLSDHYGLRTTLRWEEGARPRIDPRDGLVEERVARAEATLARAEYLLRDSDDTVEEAEQLAKLREDLRRDDSAVRELFLTP